MAGRAFRGCRFVKEYLFACDYPRLRVAAFAGSVMVRSLQREDRFLMIKQRGPPVCAVVAIAATRQLIRVGELRPMRVVMTLLAGQRSRLEVDVAKLAFHVWGAMAACAFYSPVRAHQCEFRR